MLVRPTETNPAASRRATTGAWAVAGGASASAREPAAVVSPATFEQILQADRNAGIPARRAPGTAQRVDRVRLRARRIGMDADEGAATLACGIGDAREAILDQRAGGEGAGRERVGRGFDRVHPATLRCRSLPCKRRLSVDSPRRAGGTSAAGNPDTFDRSLRR